MTEFVIEYSRQDGSFGSTLIRAEFVRRGNDDEIPLRIKEFRLNPPNVVDVVTDPSSTESTAVLRAKLTDEVARDEKILERVATPVTVQITAVPVAEQTMSLISAGPVEVTQTCTVRVDVSQRLTECDELSGLFDRQIEKRVRLRDQLEQGIAALYRAFRAEDQMTADYEELNWQHTQALALLGTAAGATALALGSVAATAAGLAMRMRSVTIGLWGSVQACAQSVTGYGLVAGSEEQTATFISTYLTRAYATAAASATGAVASAGTWELIREKMNAGLTEAQRGMANAARMRKALAQACEDKKREIHELQLEIDHTRNGMRGCPNVEIMPEPAYNPRIPDEGTWRWGPEM